MKTVSKWQPWLGAVLKSMTRWSVRTPDLPGFPSFYQGFESSSRFPSYTAEAMFLSLQEQVRGISLWGWAWRLLFLCFGPLFARRWLLGCCFDGTVSTFRRCSTAPQGGAYRLFQSLLLVLRLSSVLLSPAQTLKTGYTLRLRSASSAAECCFLWLLSTAVRWATFWSIDSFVLPVRWPFRPRPSTIYCFGVLFSWWTPLFCGNFPAVFGWGDFLRPALPRKITLTTINWSLTDYNIRIKRPPRILLACWIQH